MLCNKTVAADHSGIDQANQHAGSSSHSLKSKTGFSSDQPKFDKIGNNIKFCSKPLQTRYMEAGCLWAFKVAENDGFFALVTISTLFSIVCFCVKFLRSFQ